MTFSLNTLCLEPSAYEQHKRKSGGRVETVGYFGLADSSSGALATGPRLQAAAFGGNRLGIFATSQIEPIRASGRELMGVVPFDLLVSAIL